MSKSTKSHVRRATVAVTAALVVAAPLTIASTTQATAASGSSGTTTRPSLAASALQAAPKLPDDVRVYQTRQSLLGTHTWYRQVSGGRTVVNGWYAVHAWRNGSFTVDDERKNTATVVRYRNQISDSAAVEEALSAQPADATVTKRPSLMVLPAATANGAAHQVWRVVTADGDGITATYVDAGSGETLRTDELAQEFDDKGPGTSVTGRGRVFDPNPVVALQREGLTDRHDTSYPLIRDAYNDVKLRRLDGSHSLKGQWVRITNGNRATSNTDTYRFGRANGMFEQVSAYYALDTLQAYIQNLGFTDVNAEAQKIHTNDIPDDNSFYDPSSDLIVTGTGGVDDAEDLEVVWHEYGHAVQDDQVPSFGTTHQAASMGEGFGDYLAVTMSQKNSPDTNKTPWACVMDWDSTSYTSTEPHCLRRTDLNWTFPDHRNDEIHAAGQIWSRALWDMNQSLGRAVANKIILEAQFAFTPGITMPNAAKTTIETAAALFPGDPTIEQKTRQAFQARQIPLN